MLNLCRISFLVGVHPWAACWSNIIWAVHPMEGPRSWPVQDLRLPGGCCSVGQTQEPNQHELWQDVPSYALLLWQEYSGERSRWRQVGVRIPPREPVASLCLTKSQQPQLRCSQPQPVLGWQWSTSTWSSEQEAFFCSTTSSIIVTLLVLSTWAGLSFNPCNRVTCSVTYWVASMKHKVVSFVATCMYCRLVLL